MSTATPNTPDFAELRRKVRQALGILRSVDEELTDAVVVPDNPTPRVRDRHSPEAEVRFYRFLRAIQLEGAEGVDVARQSELIRAAGYPDPRAAGGFFKNVRGGATLRGDEAMKRRYLTTEGERQVKIGRDRFGDKIEP